MQSKPHYILCGSLALILDGQIPLRDVGDIDFCCPKEFFDEQAILKETTYPVRENDGEYLCYKISIDKFYYNVFVHTNLELVVKEIDGIRYQDSEQILHFKKIYNREKDKLDLSQITSI